MEQTQTQGISVKEQWRDLWYDERTYWQRLLIAMFPCALMAFIYCIFGPLDITLQNAESLQYTYMDILFPCLILGCAATVVLSVCLAFLRGKVFNTLVLLVLGAAIASYVQGNFLNLDLGVLDGSTIAWNHLTTHAIKNLAVWMVIIAAVVLLGDLFKKNMKRICMFTAGILVCMQTTALVVQAINTPSETKYYLSGEEQFTLSADQNTVVFILDMFGNDAFDAVKAKYPEIEKSLKDFTYYSNYNSLYYGTWPSMQYILSGHEYNYDLGYMENFDQGWASPKAEDFYELLHSQNYCVNLFGRGDAVYGGCENMVGKVDNIETVARISRVNGSAFKNLLKVSLFRYVPHGFKANFLIYSDDISAMVERAAVAPVGDHTFLEKLKKNRLRTDNKMNYLVVHHLRGHHKPYYVDELGNYNAAGTTPEQQGMGYLRMVVEYMEQMKEVGIYDSSTIIIMTDHGFGTDDPQGIFFIKEPNAVSSSGVMCTNATPISTQDLWPTILKNMGLAYESYGKTIYDFEENEMRTRTTSFYRHDRNYPFLEGKFANVFHEYTYTGDRNTLDAMIENGEITKIYILKDAFY